MTKPWVPFIAFALCWLYCNIDVQAQPPAQQEALLTIIGSRHPGSDKLSYKDLYAELEQLKPDVILWEYNKDFKKSFGVRTAAALRIARVSVEQLALQKFASNFPAIPILGFDTGFARKQAMKEMAQKGSKFYDALYAAYAEDRMKPADSLGFERYLRAQHHFNDTLLEGSLKEMNSNEWLRRVTVYFALDEAVHCQLGPKYVSDTSLLNWYARDSQFWNDRNHFMANRIREMQQRFPGKHVVVLTGLAHKPELLWRLNLSNNYPLETDRLLQQ